MTPTPLTPEHEIKIRATLQPGLDVVRGGPIPSPDDVRVLLAEIDVLREQNRALIEFTFATETAVGCPEWIRKITEGAVPPVVRLCTWLDANRGHRCVRRLFRFGVIFPLSWGIQIVEYEDGPMPSGGAKEPAIVRNGTGDSLDAAIDSVLDRWPA